MMLKKTSTWIIGDEIIKIQEPDVKNVPKIKIERGVIKDSKACTSYKIMLDKIAGTVWCDQFSNQNGYKLYQMTDIVAIAAGSGANSIYGWDRITIKDIEILAKKELEG